MGQKHIDDCLSLETGEAKDCRCADEERHYWWLARLSALGFIIQGLINFFLAGSVPHFSLIWCTNCLMAPRTLHLQ